MLTGNLFFSNRNCSGNPRCLKGLGQQSWLLNKDQDSNDGIDDDEKDAGFRKLAFCGLRNLGATCYLNTFLQVISIFFCSLLILIFQTALVS